MSRCLTVPAWNSCSVMLVVSSSPANLELPTLPVPRSRGQSSPVKRVESSLTSVHETELYGEDPTLVRPCGDAIMIATFVLTRYAKRKGGNTRI